MPVSGQLGTDALMALPPVSMDRQLGISPTREAYHMKSHQRTDVLMVLPVKDILVEEWFN